MYHYVRDLKNTRFPKLKALDISLFKEQIKYLKENYTIITMEQLIEAVDDKTDLPNKSVLLTFDDAYIDHYTQVFPILVQNNIQGSFYPPVKAVSEHVMLDVNKVHHILASNASSEQIISEIYKWLDHFRNDYQLESNKFYYSHLAKENRFDTADRIFIKRLLQTGLDESLRQIITSKLFEMFMDISEQTLASELYMNIDQLKVMKRFGMHIGAHGYNHYWLGTLSKEKQEFEIHKSLEFLKLIGSELEKWTMCYPYGSYNKDTLDVLYDKGCKLALTTNVDVVNLNIHKKYEFPRLDTRDIPIHGDISTDHWFNEA